MFSLFLMTQRHVKASMYENRIWRATNVSLHHTLAIKASVGNHYIIPLFDGKHASKTFIAIKYRVIH